MISQFIIIMTSSPLQYNKNTNNLLPLLLLLHDLFACKAESDDALVEHNLALLRSRQVPQRPLQ